MAKKEKVLTKEHGVIIGASALTLGFVIGLLLGYILGGDSTPQRKYTTVPQQQSSQPPVNFSAPGSSMQNYSEEIKALKALLEADPSKRPTWVKLGNLYFDSGQHQNAIDAYTKALEMDPNDANVMTDRGVMYRNIKDYVAAIADFRKASELDPNHTQSLMNLGIVLLHDLQDQQGALEAWEALLQRPLDPTTRSQVEGRVKALKDMLGQ